MANEEDLSNAITYFSNWSGALKGPGDSNFSGLVLGFDRLKQPYHDSATKQSGLHNATNQPDNHGAIKLILLSLWSTPITSLYDQEVWRWVEQQTLELFSTHREEHLGIFVSQIKKMYGKAVTELVAKLRRSEDEDDPPDAGPPFGVNGVGHRVRTKDLQDWGPWDSKDNFYTMCQLRRLYRLLEHDPTRPHPA
jgi:hypothetical protein